MSRLLEDEAKSLQTISEMNSVLEKQLGILMAEQKRREAELKLRPRVTLVVDGVPIREPVLQRVSLRETGKTSTMDVTPLNDGTLPALSFVLTAVTDKPGVNLGCGGGIGTGECQTVPSNGVKVYWWRLYPRSGENALISVTRLANTRDFVIQFTIEGENVARSTYRCSVAIVPN